ncbi:tryptophan synthase alpha chain [Lawsonibacter asaccharolyticus]|nr:tryptophan synthase alpha chain [Lawsonibacter asaccharolyticus]
MEREQIIVITISGRGDKDCAAIARYRGEDSMSKIAQAFARGKAFIPFITCGDPNLETTAAAVRAAVENGADLIELGIPFSDPTAEGPVIQGANSGALQGRGHHRPDLRTGADLRRDVTIPLFYDLRQCSVLLWSGALFLRLPGDGDRRTDPPRSAL